MAWVIVSVLGFALLTGVVLGLARSSTARWERDRRSSRAAVPVRAEPSLRARVAAAAAQRLSPVTRRLSPVVRKLPHPRLPHPHLAHLPHLHLPARVADRVAHTRGVLHLPHLPHPHLHLPHPRLPHRTRPPARAAAAEEPTGMPSPERPAP